jgi:Ca2+-binding EF-hand superfamily protein
MTFSVAGEIPWVDVPTALMYAGIFEEPPEPPELPIGLKQKEFLELGRDMLVAKLTKAHKKTTTTLFQKYDQTRKGSLTVGELSQCFMDTVHPNISCEEIESLADAWANDGSGQISLDSFIAIMGRFVRKHQTDWDNLCAFREMVESEHLTEVRINKYMLMNQAKKTGIELSEDEVEEMLWAAGLTNTEDEPTDEFGIDFGSFMSFIFAFLGEARGELPPPPKKTHRSASKKQVPIPEFEILPHPSKSDEDDDLKSPPIARELSSASKQTIGTTSSGQSKRTSVWVDEEPKPCFQGSPSMIALETHQTVSIRAKLHILLEEPSSSPLAARISIVMLVVIIFSVLVLVLEPLVSEGSEKKHSDDEKAVWNVMEVTFTVIFSLELLIRGYVANALGTKTTCQWLREPGTIVDIAAVLPYFTDLVLDNTGSNEFKLLRVIRLLRIGRVMRVSRMAKLSVRLCKMDLDVMQPVSVVLVVIWGIYLKNKVDDK